jgi:hypothetical protein
VGLLNHFSRYIYSIGEWFKGRKKAKKIGAEKVEKVEM